MRRARYPVTEHSIVFIRDLGESAQELAKNMRPCQRREGILPPESKHIMELHLYDTDDDRISTDQRGLVGTTSSCAAVVDIVDQAIGNRVDQAAEAAQNSDFHRPLLGIALRHSVWQKELRCDNV